MIHFILIMKYKNGNLLNINLFCGFANLLVNSKLQCNSSFRIFWNVFNSENRVQKGNFDSSQDCVTREERYDMVA